MAKAEKAEEPKEEKKEEVVEKAEKVEKPAEPTTGTLERLVEEGKETFTAMVGEKSLKTDSLRKAMLFLERKIVE